MALRSIELCAGYGGFTLGLRDYGISTVAYVERDSYAAAVLVARMEEERLDQAPIWDDLCTFDGTAWRGRVDLITAGFPCQPFSTAGNQRGVDDERWIWPNIAGIIAKDTNLVTSEMNPDGQHGMELRRRAGHFHLAQTTQPDGKPGQPKADLNPQFVAALMGVPKDWLTPYTSEETV